jgi:hypothetical protein
VRMRIELSASWLIFGVRASRHDPFLICTLCVHPHKTQTQSKTPRAENPGDPIIAVRLCYCGQTVSLSAQELDRRACFPPIA